MRIGELAAQAGVTAKTIRFYESIGLMDEPVRESNGYRDYGDDALARLSFIRDSQAAGLTLADVGEILGMKAAGLSTCGHTRTILERHVAEVDEQIARLLATRADLAAMAERAAALDPAECTDPERCQVIASNRHPATAPAGRALLPVL